MNVHKNARLTPRGRVLTIELGMQVRQAADSHGVSERTAHRWLSRYRCGDRQLQDRSSTPHRVGRRTAALVVDKVIELRRQRQTAPAIAKLLGMAISTVGALLRRAGLNRLPSDDALV